MRCKLLLSCLAFCLVIVSCNKGEETPEPKNKTKFLLKKIVAVYWDSTVFFNSFEYNQKGQLVKVSADTSGGSGTASIQYFYTADGKLDHSNHYGNIYGPNELNEVRRYTFNSSGQLVNDSAFTKDMAYMWYGIENYTYDNLGRLLRSDNTAGGGYRFEYTGNSFNPSKYIMRGTFSTNESPAIELIEYDNKKCWLGDGENIRIYFSNISGIPYSFANNVTFWKDPDHLSSNGTMIYRKINQLFEYNADGLPARCTMQETRYDAVDTFIRAMYRFEYQKL